MEGKGKHSNVDMVIEAMRSLIGDGELDMMELDRIMRIALRDGEVDDNEKRVLSNIFGKFTQADVSPMVWAEIERIRKTYGI
jgi:hypothetical protein